MVASESSACAASRLWALILVVSVKVRSCSDARDKQGEGGVWR